MHEGQRRLEPLVRQVGVELLELRRRQHALVDHGARRQRREVDVELVLGALARTERETVEFEARGVAVLRRDEHLAEDRHRAARRLTDDVGVDGDVTPAEDDEAFLVGDAVKALADVPLAVGVLRQERDADGVGALRGQLEVDDLAQ